MLIINLIHVSKMGRSCLFQEHGLTKHVSYAMYAMCAIDITVACLNRWRQGRMINCIPHFMWLLIHALNSVVVWVISDTIQIFNSMHRQARCWLQTFVFIFIFSSNHFNVFDNQAHHSNGQTWSSLYFVNYERWTMFLKIFILPHSKNVCILFERRCVCCGLTGRLCPSPSASIY